MFLETTMPRALAFIIDSTGGGETAGEEAFRDALLEGRSIDEAFGAAFDANVGSCRRRRG